MILVIRIRAAGKSGQAGSAWRRGIVKANSTQAKNEVILPPPFSTAFPRIIRFASKKQFDFVLHF